MERDVNKISDLQDKFEQLNSKFEYYATKDDFEKVWRKLSEKVPIKEFEYHLKEFKEY